VKFVFESWRFLMANTSFIAMDCGVGSENPTASRLDPVREIAGLSVWRKVDLGAKRQDASIMRLAKDKQEVDWRLTDALGPHLFQGGKHVQAACRA
jgi:hypothetical protein